MMYSKEQLFRKMLEDGGVTIAVIVDFPAVDLPPEIETEAVSLFYAYNSPKPIPDLLMDNMGIHATLSFNQSSVRTFVPWGAVIQLRNDDLLIQYVMEDPGLVKKPAPKPPTSSPKLKLV